MRIEQGVKCIVRQIPLQGLESDMLEEHITTWISHDRFGDAVASLLACINQPIARHSLLQRANFVIRIALFLGKELFAIRHEKTEVPCGGAVDEGMINLIEN